MRKELWLALALAAASVFVWALWSEPAALELPNRIPEPAPYQVAEAAAFPPPYEEHWLRLDNNPARCGMCHGDIFEQWNGSMMSNSWRDPAWRAAFLLIARLTSTDGNCSIPEPPDGSERALINPFANEDCSSSFELGTSVHTASQEGSLLDGFCSRCHMPTNYIDNIPLSRVGLDGPSGLEHGSIDPRFNPTSDNGTGIAFATLDEQFRNTVTGKRGIFCAVCHSLAETRATPFHNYAVGHSRFVPNTEDRPLEKALSEPRADLLQVADESSPNLGYGIGAGAYRLSPSAIVHAERFGPLTARDHTAAIDPYVSTAFAREIPYQQAKPAGHGVAYRTTFERSEMCGTCHDVTNPLTIMNPAGRWVGGFPIERTYSEWVQSRYADRPSNRSFDPSFKRDCQTCHMQQERGQPGTAQTLFGPDGPEPPLSGKVAASGPKRPVRFSHNFVGGNAYVPRLVGRALDESGKSEAYPELSIYSFSSADKHSPYNNAFWVGVPEGGAPSHHARLAWDRLRHVVDLELTGPQRVAAGEAAPLRITVINSGAGHNFPSGFPEGRNAWVAVRAFDLSSGNELEIEDAFWSRRSLGVGYLTREEMLDPNYPEECHWVIPPGSTDPYAVQLKAVASIDGVCPTLDLPYATPLNLVVDERGLPIDQHGRVVGRDNPTGLPRFEDLDGDGDLYDDAFLLDTRLRPLPHPEATLVLDRYAVVVPPGTVGPVAVTATVYYQSFEAIVARKFLGNLADTDGDFKLEPCVLGGPCDGRRPTVEPAVVEGPPPVAMEVATTVVAIAGRRDRTAPLAFTYPTDGGQAAEDAVPKVFFTEPVAGVDEASFELLDPAGARVPAAVDQIGDGTWALFPDRVFLEVGSTYTARLASGVCDAAGNCTPEPITWTFEVADGRGGTAATTLVPTGFPQPGRPVGPRQPDDGAPGGRADNPAQQEGRR